MKEKEMNEEIEQEHFLIEDDSNIENNFDDNYDDVGLLTGEQYDIPDDADAFIDTGDGNVIKKEDLTPLAIIKTIAKENGTKIKDPSRGCKHCYERGYEGMDSVTKMPVPCRCLFRGKSKNEKESEGLYDASQMNQKISRDQKRRMLKAMKQSLKRQRKVIKNRKDEERVVLEEPKKTSNQKVNKVLKEYIKLNSLKKTSISLKMTLTETKKIVKENKSKLEKMLKKGA